MTRRRLAHIVEQDSRVSIASASLACTIRDGRDVWTPEELADLWDIEQRLNASLSALRARLAAELEAAKMEPYPQQPGETA